MLMSDLFLHEPGVPPSLDELRDVAPSYGMEIQPVVQAEGLPVGDEPGVEPLAADPGPALGGPGGRVAVGAEQRADLGEPLVEDVGGPVEDGQHAAPLR